MDERKAFEDWAAPLRYEVHHQSNKGDYLGMATQIAWEAWQAATLAERERCAQKAGEHAQHWWSKHCASNKHMQTTREAHEDFCRLQAAIRKG